MGLPAWQRATASPAHSHSATTSPVSPSLHHCAFKQPQMQHLDGTNLPVLPFMASRNSRFSFRSNTSSLRIDAFSFSSFSFSVRNRRASSSARFFPYLYWLASTCPRRPCQEGSGSGCTDAS